MTASRGRSLAPAGKSCLDPTVIFSRDTVKTRWPKLRVPLVLAALALTGAGCTTVDLPPVDLKQPGWVVRETAAIWQPRSTTAALAGELLSARRSDGSTYVQFSKQGLPLLTARSTAHAWEISSPLRPRRYSGRLRRSMPPDRPPWFHCATVPPAPPTGSRWKVVHQPDGAWRLENPATGEFIEGLP